MHNKIGLEYILKITGMQHQELADRSGIKKQNINLWIKGAQKVPKKHLPTLSKMFGLPEELFEKDLSEVDKLAIQSLAISNQIEGSIVHVPTTKYDKKQGKWVASETTHYNENAIEAQRLIDVEIDGLEVLENIKQDIFNSSSTTNTENYIGHVSSSINAYKLLYNVREKVMFNDNTIETVLHCLRNFSELGVSESEVEKVSEEEAINFDFEEEFKSLLLQKKKIDIFKQKELLELYQSIE